MTTWDEALEEAYASAPVDNPELFTLAFHHPNFRDEFGQPTAIYVVAAYENHMLRLENTAPLNPGEKVEFIAMAFDFQHPSYEEGKVPTLPITIDGVSREISQQLELAISSLQPIDVYARTYLLSDPEGPQIDPPYRFTLTDVQVDVFQVTGTCNLQDVHNWPFPANKYTRDRFPGLVR